MQIIRCEECLNYELGACDDCDELSQHLDFIKLQEDNLKYYLKELCNFSLDKPDYKKLDIELSSEVRSLYDSYASTLNLDESKPLYTFNGIKLSEGFERVVIGDYGAYIEYDLSQVPQDMKYIYETGEEYRVQPYWKNRVKYIWYTTQEHDCKIYWQLRTVSYADYKRKKFYVSPYEIYQI